MMKIALVFLIGCLLVVVGTVVFAPEYVHEIIDRVHDNAVPAAKSQVLESENEHSNSQADQDHTTTTQSPKFVIIRRGGTIVVEDEDLATTPQLVTQPQTEKQMLSWLRAHNYEVETGQGVYRISWQMRKRTSSKPTAIVVSRDGTVVPRYERTVVVNEDGAAVVGENVVLNGSGCSLSGRGRAVVTNRDRITTTASLTYENGSWWIKTTRSFLWIPSRNNINDVLSRAKKIKSE